jgi:hypothetical protein
MAIGVKAPYPGFIEPALALSIERVPSEGALSHANPKGCWICRPENGSENSARRLTKHSPAACRQARYHHRHYCASGINPQRDIQLNKPASLRDLLGQRKVVPLGHTFRVSERQVVAKPSGVSHLAALFAPAIVRDGCYRRNRSTHELGSGKLESDRPADDRSYANHRRIRGVVGHIGKFSSERPFADPEKAARKLLEVASTQFSSPDNSARFPEHSATRGISPRPQQQWR